MAAGAGGARDCGSLDDACASGYTFFRRDTQVRMPPLIQREREVPHADFFNSQIQEAISAEQRAQALIARENAES